jgi:hypothetical protein
MNAARYLTCARARDGQTSSPFCLVSYRAKSYRSVVFKKFPRTEVPDHFAIVSQFNRTSTS